MTLNDAEAPETSFLDIFVQCVLHDPGIPAIEPWATLFINVVHDRRFGDAIWARYHIFGDVEDGMLEKFTVLDAVKDDAMRYKKFEPEIYAESVAFYKDTMNSADTHPEVIEIIMQVNEQDLSDIDIPEGRKGNGYGGEWAEKVRLLPAFPATCATTIYFLHLEAIPDPKTMVDPSSLVASIAGLISLADVTFKYTYKFVRAVKDAKTDVSTLTNETNNLGNVLRVLEVLAPDLEAERDQFDPTLRNHYLNHCFETLRRIELKTKKATKRFVRSKAESIYQHLKWRFSSSETKNLLDELSRHKETISMALAADLMQKLQLSLTKIDKLGESISAAEKIVKRIEINTLIDANAHKKRILNYFMKVDPFWHKIELGGT
ncbi:ankyrin repeat [Fusarium sporotrichioides]|uniref:Ankyrin repeat n=1 Tax=Fusarium sporotrichioides TaxID=5514 RepID=A0A395SCC4_FUSSP|nr:ankyrin repeat [Fusarium sporotrichioides]